MRRQTSSGNAPDGAADDGALLPAFHLAALPRPVYLRAEQLFTGQAFVLHTHPWNQLVHATSGPLVVVLETARYLIGPEQAIWLPTGVVHTSGSLGEVAFRSLYVADDAPGLRMPRRCRVLEVSPLLRALIVELHALAGREAEEETYLEHLEALVLDQLHRARENEVSLPWPHSPALRELCQALYEEPGDPRTVEAWGETLATGPRTLARRFEAETGMTLRDWRRRLRLFRALEALATGRGVTEIALDLGYASPSAFAFMFRQAMGCSPLAWRGRRAAHAAPEPARAPPG